MNCIPNSIHFLPPVSQTPTPILVSSFFENHWGTSEECSMAIQCSMGLPKRTSDGINQAALHREPPQTTLALEANMPILPFAFEDWLPPNQFQRGRTFYDDNSCNDVLRSWRMAWEVDRWCISCKTERCCRNPCQFSRLNHSFNKF